MIVMCVPSLDSRKDSNVMHIRGPATATARLVSQMGQGSTICTLMYIDHNNQISALESNKNTIYPSYKQYKHWMLAIKDCH